MAPHSYHSAHACRADRGAGPSPRVEKHARRKAGGHAHGKITSYGEAAKIITDSGMALAQGSKPGRSVWLVVFDDEAVEHVPASADCTITQRDAQHAQMAIIIDGSTGGALQ